MFCSCHRMISNAYDTWHWDGIATGYGLDGPGSNPVGGIFSAPVQTAPGPTETPVQ